MPDILMDIAAELESRFNKAADAGFFEAQTPEQTQIFKRDFFVDKVNMSTNNHYIMVTFSWPKGLPLGKGLDIFGGEKRIFDEMDSDAHRDTYTAVIREDEFTAYSS